VGCSASTEIFQWVPEPHGTHIFGSHIEHMSDYHYH